MSEAPEKLLIDPDHVPDHSDHFGELKTYIREDLHLSTKAQADALAEAAEAVCVKCESATEAVTIIDQQRLRAALSAYKEGKE